MDIFSELKQRESQSILEGLVLMAYNPSIGRVLEKGGVNKFVKLMVDRIEQLQWIKNEEEFDTFHSKVIDLIKSDIKTI